MTVEILRQIDEQSSRGSVAVRRAAQWGLGRQISPQGFAAPGEAHGGRSVVPMLQPDQSRQRPIKFGALAKEIIRASPRKLRLFKIGASGFLKLALRLELHVAVDIGLRFCFLGQDLSPLVGLEGSEARE